MDSDWLMVNIELNAAEAALAVGFLAHLAALIDADDHDGLRDAFGRRIDEHLLTDMQAKLLSHEPDEVKPDTRHCVTDVVFAGSCGAPALVGGCRLSQPRAGVKTISKNAMSRCDTFWPTLAL